MKKLELYIGIALMIITTVLICIYMFALSYTNERLMFVSFVSLIGYIISYLYVDSYISRTEIHHYTKGYDDAKEDIKSKH